MGDSADIGIYGLGVMGRNLALNFADRGFAVSLFDPWAEARAAARAVAHARVVIHDSADAFAASLARPRHVLLMVKAGGPVDAAVAALKPALQPGDALFDGGNSHFADTQRRQKALAEQAVDFLGIGISGGEDGARHGPSLMIGGAAQAYERSAPLFHAIAARYETEPCCAWFGEDGAGHFVKMVHNGIEYAEMQILAEAYALMQIVGGIDNGAMQAVFRAWSAGEAQSFLTEITAAILGRVDPETGHPLVDLVLDEAEQKGTGQWAAESALALGVPAPTLSAAVTARALSALLEERRQAAGMLAGPSAARVQGSGFVERLGKAVLGAKIGAFAQGFALLAAGAREHGWAMNLARVAEVWRAGCIIRGRLLAPIASALHADPALPNLLVAGHFRDTLAASHADWRLIVGMGASAGVPLPALGSALAYYDAYRSARLPANLIQSQRDYFGAHGYRRTDRDGVFHTDWTKP
ncbi:MAG TPA: NADP-dependent phosphogluconate dehydrogenase [Candidatus Cybelea sp.]|nr:NADP-dependent phosphogluconate dehydrogenase [Candidatus Cybelea sp.]